MSVVLSSSKLSILDTNNNQNELTKTKSFDQAIDHAVNCFQEILAECFGSNSRGKSDRNNEQEDNTHSKLEAKKRDCLEYLRKQYVKKADCRKWCEEQSRRPLRKRAKGRSYRSKTQNIVGHTFYCRKALLQQPNGVTYICIRKRFL